MGKLTHGDFPGLIGPVLARSVRSGFMGSIRRLVANHRRVAAFIAAVCHARRDYAAADDCQYFDCHNILTMGWHALCERFFAAAEFVFARRRLSQNQIPFL